MLRRDKKIENCHERTIFKWFFLAEKNKEKFRHKQDCRGNSGRRNIDTEKRKVSMFDVYPTRRGKNYIVGLEEFVPCTPFLTTTRRRYEPRQI